MPLHLLGKKSWNVYNQDNIARVKRDEARAKALEEENEREAQEIDAERRIESLRQQQLQLASASQGIPSRTATEIRSRKRRRLAGEDDTDRDIRLAREDAVVPAKGKNERLQRKSTSDAPLIDAAGHISLFPSERPRSEKNEELEAEKAKKKQEYEDQYTMRLQNAAGYRQKMEAPWYSTSTSDLAVQAQGAPTKDVWGNEDPRRREREKMRIDANDPLSMMKKGVRKLREVEKERKVWEEERRRELDSLREETKETTRHRRRRSRSYDSLEDFKLDENSTDQKNRERKHRSGRSNREHRDSRRHGHRHKHSHHGNSERSKVHGSKKVEVN